MRFAAVFVLALAFPLGAQEFGFHTATIVRRSSNDLAYGLGASIAGSFRLGDILVDTALARKASLRIGGRAALSETRYDDRDLYRCIDFCAPNAHDVSVRARMTKVTVFVLPLHSETTRLEIGGGVANNVYTRTYALDGSAARDNAWSFVGGIAASGRLWHSPLWLQLEYTRHGRPPYYTGGGGAETPAHSLTAGLVYRLSDRRGQPKPSPG